MPQRPRGIPKGFSIGVSMSEASSGAPRGALDGVRVLEIGVFIAAPFAALQLADLGADVIKIESPAGEPVRASGPFVAGESSPFLRLNRSQALGRARSEVSRRANARSCASRRMRTSSSKICVPARCARSVLSYDDLRAVNPRVVYASASGFGQDGPLADRPGLDIMAQARGGLMSITGAPGRPAGEDRRADLRSWSAGLYVALGIMAALRERDRAA